MTRSTGTARVIIVPGLAVHAYAELPVQAPVALQRGVTTSPDSGDAAEATCLVSELAVCSDSVDTLINEIGRSCPWHRCRRYGRNPGMDSGLCLRKSGFVNGSGSFQPRCWSQGWPSG